MPSCELIPLDRYNWEQALEIQITEAQHAFVPSILYSLAQAKFEALTPFGVMYEGQMIGFLMYGQFGKICWINRVIIDKRFQGKGLGKTALKLLLRKLNRQRSCQEIRTSHAVDNQAAIRLFEASGFQVIPADLGDGEVVRVWAGE